MRHYLLSVVVIVFSGCSYFVSWDDVSEPVIGHTMEEIGKIWDEPDEIIPLPKGQKEYKYHLKKLDPSCIHYWIVDEQGVITGYRYEGRCRPIG